jgi:hypothetical protein
MVGEWYVESRHLQGYNPRLSQLRTDGLAPASKGIERTERMLVFMGPVGLVATVNR